jgi:uncharacterized protein YyaL (SSP411 family)
MIVRTRSLYDLAISSGNSIAASNLLRLYHLTHRNDYLEKAEQIMMGGAKSSAENPFGFGPSSMLILLSLIAVLGTVILNEISQEHDPRKVIRYFRRACTCSYNPLAPVSDGIEFWFSSFIKFSI